MKQVLKVEGMSCAHCVSSIEGALQEENVEVKVDLANETVEVEYAEDAVSMDLIKETIEDLGYDVQ